MRRFRAPSAPIVAAVTVLLAGPVTACSSSSTPTPPPPSSAPKTTTLPTPSPSTSPTTPVVRRWPLTGLPVHGRLPDHPVYVVKVDNTSSAAPQLGLDDADMIVEELVEGGLTRLAAFYYSTIPPQVGPVRSMRASDIGITEPAKAFIVASGAAGKTMVLLNAAGINRITEGAVGFYRSSARPAPYNLMMKLPALAQHVDRPWQRPSAPYLPFGPPGRFTGTTPVRTMSVTFSGAHTDDWRLQGRTWVRTNSFAQSGHDFSATNVLILRVRIGNAGYLDPGGNPVPETFFYGSGQATLVHGAHAESGTWHKRGTHGVVTLTDAQGHPLTVPDGHTFIELLPAVGGSVRIGR